MKRLFEIRVGQEHYHEYFERKADAKKRRDVLIEEGKNARVSRGPDHADGASKDV